MTGMLPACTVAVPTGCGPPVPKRLVGAAWWRLNTHHTIPAMMITSSKSHNTLRSRERRGGGRAKSPGGGVTLSSSGS